MRVSETAMVTVVVSKNDYDSSFAWAYAYAQEEVELGAVENREWVSVRS